MTYGSGGFHHVGFRCGFLGYYFKGLDHNSKTYLKGTNTQHSGHISQIFKTEKNINIQLVGPTEVCGEV